MSCPADKDFMTDITANIGLLHMIQCLSGNQRKILPDRPTTGNVQKLHSPADGEDRFTGRKNLSHQMQLKNIGRDACTSVPGKRGFTKKERCDIAASAKEKSITEGNILIQQIF